MERMLFDACKMFTTIFFQFDFFVFIHLSIFSLTSMINVNDIMTFKGKYQAYQIIIKEKFVCRVMFDMLNACAHLKIGILKVEHQIFLIFRNDYQVSTCGFFSFDESHGLSCNYGNTVISCSSFFVISISFFFNGHRHFFLSFSLSRTFYCFLFVATRNVR